MAERLSLHRFFELKGEEIDKITDVRKREAAALAAFVEGEVKALENDTFDPPELGDFDAFKKKFPELEKYSSLLLQKDKVQALRLQAAETQYKAGLSLIQTDTKTAKLLTAKYKLANTYRFYTAEWCPPCEIIHQYKNEWTQAAREGDKGIIGFEIDVDRESSKESKKDLPSVAFFSNSFTGKSAKGEYSETLRGVAVRLAYGEGYKARIKELANPTAETDESRMEAKARQAVEIAALPARREALTEIATYYSDQSGNPYGLLSSAQAEEFGVKAYKILEELWKTDPEGSAYTTRDLTFTIAVKLHKKGDAPTALKLMTRLSGLRAKEFSPEECPSEIASGRKECSDNIASAFGARNYWLYGNGHEKEAMEMYYGLLDVRGLTPQLRQKYQWRIFEAGGVDPDLLQFSVGANRARGPKGLDRFFGIALERINILIQEIYQITDSQDLSRIGVLRERAERDPLVAYLTFNYNEMREGENAQIRQGKKSGEPKNGFGFGISRGVERKLLPREVEDACKKSYEEYLPKVEAAMKDPRKFFQAPLNDKSYLILALLLHRENETTNRRNPKSPKPTLSVEGIEIVKRQLQRSR